MRLVQSLTTLKVIHDSPVDYHSGKDALIVGDIDVGVVLLNGEEKYLYLNYHVREWKQR